MGDSLTSFILSCYRYYCLPFRQKLMRYEQMKMDEVSVSWPSAFVQFVPRSQIGGQRKMTCSGHRFICLLPSQN